MAACSVVYRSRLKQVQEKKKENIDLIKKWWLIEYYFMFMIIGPLASLWCGKLKRNLK